MFVLFASAVLPRPYVLVLVSALGAQVLFALPLVVVHEPRSLYRPYLE